MLNTYSSWRTGVQIDNIYPVGSVYISVNSTNPHDLFGGTWEAVGGRFLIGVDSTYTAGSTGGSTTVAAHSHSISARTSDSTTLTTAQIPAHTHTRGTMNITGGFAPWSEGAGSDITGEQGAFYSVASNQYGWGTTTGRDSDNEYMYFDASRSWTGETSSVGGGEGHTHSVPAATTSEQAAVSNMPPYLVVYMWKRTA